MNNNEEKIYRYDDKISFRQCSLANESKNTIYGNCTSFEEREEDWKRYYYCKQNGIHFHCTKHPEIELQLFRDDLNDRFFSCPKCNETIIIENFQILIQDCLKLLNIPKFKNAKLIKLDDWYVPELKGEIENEKFSDYWVKYNVKTDKDGDTMIVLYVGNRNSKEKAQFFIKPEKLQLSTDYKDLDPATVLSKIEVTLKDRTIKQEYDKNN